MVTRIDRLARNIGDQAYLRDADLFRDHAGAGLL
jgi:hypothetical protein